jgi:hypothetical protein
MPTVNAYFHDDINGHRLDILVPKLRQVIAEKLSGQSRTLTPQEVSLRLIEVRGEGMIAPLELEILAHRYEERVGKADAICRELRHMLLDHLPISDARVWLTLTELGHSWMD